MSDQFVDKLPSVSEIERLGAPHGLTIISSKIDGGSLMLTYQKAEGNLGSIATGPIGAAELVFRMLERA